MISFSKCQVLTFVFAANMKQHSCSQKRCKKWDPGKGEKEYKKDVSSFHHPFWPSLLSKCQNQISVFMWKVFSPFPEIHLLPRNYILSLQTLFCLFYWMYCRKEIGLKRGFREEQEKLLLVLETSFYFGANGLATTPWQIHLRWIFQKLFFQQRT